MSLYRRASTFNSLLTASSRISLLATSLSSTPVTVQRSPIMSSAGKQKIVLVGGHGKVSLLFTKLVSKKYQVESVIRNPDHSSEIESLGAKPIVLSIEDSPKAEFTSLFDSASIVVWSAGAGGKGGEERTKKVDYEGAVKVFDAIEGVEEGKRPRLLLVSAIDVRDTSKPPPSHYNEQDIERSKKGHAAIGTYMEYKRQADINLSKRNTFPWTILRPGSLLDEPGTGKVSLGRTHLTPGIPREDVAAILAALVERPDAAGLAIDAVGGDEPIEEALDRVIKRKETDFLG